MDAYHSLLLAFIITPICVLAFRYWLNRKLDQKIRELNIRLYYLNEEFKHHKKSK